MRSSESPRAVRIRIGVCDIGAHGAREIEPAFAGHHHVQDQEIERHAFHQRARFFRVGRSTDAKAVGSSDNAAAARAVWRRRRRRADADRPRLASCSSDVSGIARVGGRTRKDPPARGGNLPPPPARLRGRRAPAAAAAPPTISLRARGLSRSGAIAACGDRWARAALDITALQQIVEHAIEALFRDLQDAEVAPPPKGPGFAQ